MIIVAYVAALAGVSPTLLSDPKAFLIAQQIGNYAGYRKRSSHVEYEAIDSKRRQIYPGYRTFALSNGLQAVYDLSVELSSGRVFDFTRCLVFEYPPVREVVRARHAAVESYGTVFARNGCDRYRILRRPGDDGRARSIKVF